MQFTKVIGSAKNNEGLISKAEEKLSSVFLELGASYNNEYIGTHLGGDPLIFSLIYPLEHICTVNMPTAATDGKKYYWNPKFVIKKSKIGLRLICLHEALHALYMHPQRRGSRLPKLWNIAVDYIVNNFAMEDLKARKKNPHELFTKELGRYMPLSGLMEIYKNPFQPLKGFEDLHPGINMSERRPSKVKLPRPDEDRELTPEEQKELERQEQSIKYYYADPDLEEDIKRPEKIYDMLYNLLPKCPKCGSVGIYHPPQDKSKKNKGKGQDKSKDKDKGQGQDKSQGQDQGDDQDQDNQGQGNNQDQNDQGQGDGQDQNDQGQGDNQNNCPSCGSCGCPDCDKGFDIFDLGGTLDEHMDSSESEEKLAKRVAEAMEAAKRMAGKVPGGLEDELGLLTAPKVTWKDVIRTRILKARDGNGRNDWTRFRTRPMFAGLLIPKKRDFFAKFGCLLDTSGSMSTDDMTYGVSQLQSLDERAEGTLVPADAEIFWEKATKLKNCKAEELSKIKVCGRGGTVFGSFTSDYKEKIGKCDFLIFITDGYLSSGDIDNMKDPGIDVYWLITSTSDFKPPFGRVLSLRD